ncbi:hypothetical protein D3C73_401670 [compost metagenome]
MLIPQSPANSKVAIELASKRMDSRTSPKISMVTAPAPKLLKSLRRSMPRFLPIQAQRLDAFPYSWLLHVKPL